MCKTYGLKNVVNLFSSIKSFISSSLNSINFLSYLVSLFFIIEAKSVEDQGDGILFNVYCYNIQPGVTINYADGSNQADGTATAATKEPVATKGRLPPHRGEGAHRANLSAARPTAPPE